MRASTTPPKIRLKPIVAASSGQRKAGSIADFPMVMLGGWCRLFHHTTERLMIGTLIAPTSPKIAATRLLPPPSRRVASTSAI